MKGGGEFGWGRKKGLTRSGKRKKGNWHEYDQNILYAFMKLSKENNNTVHWLA